MFINNFDPVAFSFFSLQIKWYSISYILGIVLGWSYCKKKLIQDNKILNLFDDSIIYIIFGVIIGGRLGYVFIYNFKYYLENTSEIFMIWNGGMSFHGGLIGVIIAVFFYSKKHKINAFIFLDLISLVAPIGIFFGRLANFINSELYGKETDVLWSVKFLAIDSIQRHPSQIYEAILEGIILFILLNYIYTKKIFTEPGLISAFFLILYSLFRFLMEFFRVPDVQIGYIIFNLSLGQILSIIFFVLGICLFLKKNNAA
tara:strand:+ start:218 stop:991 length:774 start_codon:yes stop_codon:yes gene_type:complete